MEVIVQDNSAELTEVSDIECCQAVVKTEENPLFQRFQPGEIFTSHQELIDVLTEYQQQNHVYFVRQSVERIRFEPLLMERLVYRRALFVCKQGKRKARPQTRGIRPNQKSWKVGCKAFFCLGLTKQPSGDYVLQVKKSNLEHNNHPVNAENAVRYPENRRVAIDDTIKCMINTTSVSNRDLVEYIRQDQAKVVYSQDLGNLKRKVRQECNNGDTPPKVVKRTSVKSKVLTEEERHRDLQPLLLNGWALCQDRDAIHKEFLFSNFNEAFRFICGVGLESNRIGHYPDWHNYYNKVSIILQTQPVSGITPKDIKLALYIDSLAS